MEGPSDNAMTKNTIDAALVAWSVIRGWICGAAFQESRKQVAENITAEAG